MQDYQDRNSIAEIENDKKQEALEHYCSLLDESISEKSEFKAVDCMANAELFGEDQDLICQLLIDKCTPQLMNIVANGCALIDPSLQEATESTRMVRELVDSIKEALSEHYENKA